MWVVRLGRMEYLDAASLQQRLAGLRRENRVPDVLLLLEHPHTFTLGRRGSMDHLLIDERELARQDIRLFHTDRGGDITYHGPGQLVGYPIVKLTGPRTNRVQYLRDLETGMVSAVRELGVAGSTRDGLAGVWVQDSKVCAMGAKIDAFGVTTHGFGLNVSTDLAYFAKIVPCGLHGMGVTSLDRELARRLATRRAETVVARHVAAALRRLPQNVSRRRLEARLAAMADG